MREWGRVHRNIVWCRARDGQLSESAYLKQEQQIYCKENDTVRLKERHKTPSMTLMIHLFGRGRVCLLSRKNKPDGKNDPLSFLPLEGGKGEKKEPLFPIDRNSRISTTCRSINTGLMKIIGTRSHLVRVAAIEDPFPFLCPPMLQLSRHCPHLDGTKLLFPCPISPGCITSVAQISICLFIGRWFFVTSPAVVLSVVPVPTDFCDK